jgi:8-amino-7-oxononanoate synthase
MSNVEQAKSDLAQRMLGALARKKGVENVDNAQPASGQSTVQEAKRLADHPGIAETRDLLQLAKVHGMDGSFFAPQKKLGKGRALTEDGRSMVNYGCYDYLGFGDDLEVREAAREAISEYGTSLGAARIVGGEIDLSQQLEAEITDFLDTESTMLFVSGYLTNLAYLGYVLKQTDLVIHDELSHNSMITGVKLSGAKRLAFKHNNPDHLDSMLKLHRNTAEVCLVMIEGVYSMEGDIARLPEILEVARRHNCDIFIDDAHSLGVIGKAGRGILEQYGIPQESDIVLMNTLSKTLVSGGGFVAGNKPLIDAVRYQAPGATLFCASLPPAQTAAALAALRKLNAAPELPGKLRGKAKILADELTRHGLNIGPSSGTAVIPVLTGSSVAAVKLSSMLRERGIIAYSILYPAVPDHMARLRFFVNATHQDEDLIETAAVVAECAKEAGVPETVPGYEYQN